MLTKIIEFSVKNKLIVALLILALIGVGAYQVTKLPIDAVPDITNNQVQVITIAPSFGATDIERLVTFPIEQANSNIAGLQEIRSFSRFGLSLVTIVFEDNIDIYWARQQVAERLQQVQQEIPQGIGQPQLGPISTGLGEIYQYVVRPQQGYERKYNVTALRTIQDWIVRRQLLGVKGVAEVSSFGGKLKQYEIAVNPDRLNAYGVTINDVFDALNTNNQNTGGAYIEKGPTVLYIRSEGLVGTIADIQNIAITSKQNDLPIFIRDIAEVKTGYATRYGAMTYNDNGEVAGAIVMMLKGANSSQVIADVKAKVEEIRKTLPKGVIIEPFLDRTKMVNNAINTVQTNLLEGALIVVFVLVLFLGNIRAGLLVASVIPLAMLFAICMMNLFGVSGNLMSLGALDFGLIIDGAVIIVESVMHQLLQQQRFKSLLRVSAAEMDNMVTVSAGRMMNSAVFGQIIILVVYLPILTLEGIEGKMFKPMAETVAFALLGAFLLSLTYIPMMSAILLRARSSKPSLSDRLMKRLEKIYVHVLLKVLRFPRVIFAVVISFFILAIIILSRLGGEFIPSLEEGDFAVDTRVLPGSNLTTTIESTQKAAHILKSRFPEVEKVVTKIGSGEVPTDPMPMEASDMMVILKDKKEWTSAHTFPELAKKMGKALTDVPGITAGFQYPVQMRFNELMTGARQDVVLKIFGDNLDSLALHAQKIGKIIETVQGTQNLYIEPIAGLPQVVIQYNRPMIAQHHLSIAEVNKTINTAFAGQPTGLVFEDEKRFDMVVRMDTSDRKNMTDVRNLLIPTPAGNQIPLSQLASVAIVQGPNQIQRENAQRRIVVGFNIKDRDVQSIVHDLQAKIDQEIKLPAGYSIKYGGSFENLNNAKQRLLIAVPIALALIFILLFLAFKSVKESLLIYSAIPLSIIGGVFLLALRGMPFSISAGVGFIALFGVAVLNGIVLISEFNRLQKSGIHNIVRIVVDGGENRLRPVLMTASVASLGFIPMALSDGAGAEVQRPLATVVIGGLLIATLLTLFVLPLLYVVIEKGFRGTKLKPKVIAPILFVIALLSIENSNAQTVVTLDQSIVLALQNNRSLKSEKLRAAYAKALIGTSTADIPQTEIGLDYGQINSAYQDAKLSVVQRFAFPAVYRKLRARYTEEWKKSQLNVALKEFELKKAVSLTYYNILYWQQKKELLNEALSLYSSFLDKTILRQKAGESDALESATATNQNTAIVIQLRQVDAEIKVLQSQFQWLLNTDLMYTPASTGKVAFNPPSIENHPLLKVLKHGKIVADQATAVEKSKLLPQLQLGYNLNSFKGVGPDNRTYDANPRFHSVQVGLAIPVFSKGQKARVEASRLAEAIAEDEYQNAEFALERRKQEFSQRYKSSFDIIDQYETSELKNADTIFEMAQKQFSNGAINYLELVTLVNQAISLKSNYADALWQLNESAIQLHYIMLNQ
ncbi:CusA/CzcA family heavy metal efflux RND transporter [Sphingobacterium sp. ML3W]|uniref:CusA/CzcA family heavy metal efflux RND transporter n=1 Tax=Sphingobacterium sp. ML3W TaxID=1538644 RepID=UPI00249A6695|nr:CusA/CzcA family heavy metal efflux RND transporter [Sphingobacterium sp. ML3W]WFA80792.1 CusA/CzcA family heavy metal efflux RND transporter [Sphingobacterium sp. ML3W]